MFSRLAHSDNHTIGCAWFIKSRHKQTYYSYIGGGLGYLNAVRYYPKSKLLTVLLMNVTARDKIDIVNSLDDQFLNKSKTTVK